MKYEYPAIFRPLESGSYYVEIPDLPNCQTEGKDFPDACDMAADVIAFWICSSEDHGEEIPAASELHAIRCSDAEKVLLISVDTTVYRQQNSIVI